MMLLNHLNHRNLKRRRGLNEHSLWAILVALVYACGLAGCSDVSTAPLPDPGPGPLTITTTSLPNGTVNQPYATTVGGSGGITPYSWSVTPLPANLSFNQTTGAITGTPAAQGTSAHTFTLQDSSSPVQTVQRSLSLTINTASASPTITTMSLPNGAVGQAYNQTVQATGGTGALTWSIVAGTLPQNLSLNPTTGVISGMPTAAGSSSFTIRVADTAGQADTQVLSILINQPTPPSITTTTLPGGTIGQAYSQTLQATGGTGTLISSLFGGSLPANLALSSAGVISGTPTNTGTSNFTAQVTDALSQSDTQPLSITIGAAPTPLTITTTSPLPAGKVGVAYSTTLTASGGTPPYSNWSVSPALPADLLLDASTGAITGTPGLFSAGTTIHTFSVQDSTSLTANKPNMSLTITLF